MLPFSVASTIPEGSLSANGGFLVNLARMKIGFHDAQWNVHLQDIGRSSPNHALLHGSHTISYELHDQDVSNVPTPSFQVQGYSKTENEMSTRVPKEAKRKDRMLPLVRPLGQVVVARVGDMVN